MQQANKKVAEWWSDPQRDVPGTQWLEVPGTSENMNLRATGDPKMDWVNHSASLLSAFKKPVKALSLGCGFGVIERVLRRRDYCQLIHGVDVADGAIEGARKTAEMEGLDGLTYEVADLNTATFPKETYDAVYAHAALHHVFQLEHLLNQVKQTLKPGGLFIVYEYIGPSQMQFPRRDLELADVFLNIIPERYRTMARPKSIKKEALRLSLEAMNNSDPSESIRASEIVPLTASRFELKHFRYVGGTLPFLIFSQIAHNFREDDAEIMPLVRALLALDNFLVDNAVLPSYHVYMVCENTQNPMPMQTRNILPPTAAVFPTNDLQTRIATPSPTGSITVEPNPFQADSDGLGQATVSWMTYGTSKVEVHVDAPDGPVFTRTGPGRFSHETGHWIRDGMRFYLQNVSDGLALSPENTMAIVTLRSA